MAQAIYGTEKILLNDKELDFDCNNNNNSQNLTTSYIRTVCWSHDRRENIL